MTLAGAVDLTAGKNKNRNKKVSFGAAGSKFLMQVLRREHTPGSGFAAPKLYTDCCSVCLDLQTRD